MPALSQDDFEAICEIVAGDPEAKISALARAVKADIDVVKQTGA